MRTDEGRVLVDWDTVALAPPERDLWMVVGDTADEATIYANATGHHLDQVAANFFRLARDGGAYQRAWTTVPLCSVQTFVLALQSTRPGLAFKASGQPSVGSDERASRQCSTWPAGDS